MSGNFYKLESADKYSPQVISAIWPKYMDVCICCFKFFFKRKEKINFTFRKYNFLQVFITGLKLESVRFSSQS